MKINIIKCSISEAMQVSQSMQYSKGATNDTCTVFNFNFPILLQTFLYHIFIATNRINTTNPIFASITHG